MTTLPHPLIRCLGATIREARISPDLTQAQLAELSGLTRLRIIDIEKGSPSISMEAYFKTATSMGLEQ